MASKFLERFHDPAVNRRIFVSRVASFIVEYLKPYKSQGIHSDDELHRLQNRIEMDVWKYARSQGIWEERELPLRVKLQYHKGKMNVDFNGPMGGEVFIAMHDYLNFSHSIGPVGEGEEFDEDDDDEDDEVEEGGFHYGR